MTAEFLFKRIYTHEERVAKHLSFVFRHAPKVAIVIEEYTRDSKDQVFHTVGLERDRHVGSVLHLVRRKYHLKPTEAVFMFVGDGMVPNNQSTLGEVYDEFKDTDGHLYFCFAKENTFGMEFQYKIKTSFHDRREKYLELSAKNPDKVMILLERYLSPEVFEAKECHKFVVPRGNSAAQFLAAVRSRCKIKPEEALFLFVGGGVQPNNAATIGELYDEYKDLDGLLYISYSMENTFG